MEKGAQSFKEVLKICLVVWTRVKEAAKVLVKGELQNCKDR